MNTIKESIKIDGEEPILISEANHQVSGAGRLWIGGKLFLTPNSIIFEPDKDYYKKYSFKISLSEVTYVNKSSNPLGEGPYFYITIRRQGKDLTYNMMLKDADNWLSKIKGHSPAITSKRKYDLMQYLFIFLIILVGGALYATAYSIGTGFEGLISLIIIFGIPLTFVFVAVVSIKSIRQRKLMYQKTIIQDPNKNITPSEDIFSLPRAHFWKKNWWLSIIFVALLVLFGLKGIFYFILAFLVVYTRYSNNIDSKNR
ncbi:MAG: hypothetical protein KKE20_02330 [Nanoarchaeota archaeon]|nr:hypothetical protein [Nanoarchaeota archaeon]